MLWLLLIACRSPMSPPPAAILEPAAPTAPEAPQRPAAAPGHALILRPTQLPTRTGPLPYANDLLYLQDELRWIEARTRRIALEQRLREAESAPRAAQAARLASRRSQEHAIRAEIDARKAASPMLAIDRLCATLGLDAFERLVLLLAAAPCCSRRFEDIFGLLDKDGSPNTLTVEVVFNFAELPFGQRIRHRRCFSPGAPLINEDLLVVDLRQRAVAPRDLLMADLELTGRAFAYLIGQPDITDELSAFSSVEAPLATLDAVVLPDPARARIQAVVDNHDRARRLRQEWGIDAVVRYGQGTLMLFYGPPGTGKTMTAHGVAHRMGRRLLNVDVPTFIAHEEAGRFLPGLFREARLQGAVLFFDECETLLRSRSAGNVLMSILLTELERFEGVAILATNRPSELDDALARRLLLRLRFDEPDPVARAAIWEHHLPPRTPRAADVDVTTLAARYPLSGGDIKNAVLMAISEALYDGSPDQLCQAHLDRAARTQLSRPTMAPLRTPAHTLQDLILPPAQHHALEGILRAVQSDQRVRLVLSGPTGCGRSTCAAALAGSLRRPLLPASPATLQTRLQEARRQHAVLHIDGLSDTMLDPELTRQLAESPGLIVIECDTIRDLPRPIQEIMSVHISLPFPDQPARAALWQHLLPQNTEVDTSALSQHRLSGGQIAQTIAALRATDQPLTTHSLQHALTQREGHVGF